MYRSRRTSLLREVHTITWREYIDCDTLGGAGDDCEWCGPCSEQVVGRTMVVCIVPWR